jgi:hypothetical protein
MVANYFYYTLALEVDTSNRGVEIQAGQCVILMETRLYLKTEE